MPPPAPPAPASVYRFATCAMDCRLLLWEFDAADMARANVPGPAVAATAVSANSKAAAPTSGGGVGPLGHGGGGGRAAPFRAVPALEATIAEQLHAYPICGLLVGPATITTACMAGSVKLWARPTTDWT